MLTLCADKPITSKVVCEAVHDAAVKADIRKRVTRTP
jgi:hypothetical protein